METRRNDTYSSNAGVSTSGAENPSAASSHSKRIEHAFRYVAVSDVVGRRGADSRGDRAELPGGSPCPSATRRISAGPSV